MSSIDCWRIEPPACFPCYLRLMQCVILVEFSNLPRSIEEHFPKRRQGFPHKTRRALFHTLCLDAKKRFMSVWRRVFVSKIGFFKFFHRFYDCFANTDTFSEKGQWFLYSLTSSTKRHNHGFACVPYRTHSRNTRILTRDILYVYCIGYWVQSVRLSWPPYHFGIRTRSNDYFILWMRNTMIDDWSTSTARRKRCMNAIRKKMQLNVWGVKFIVALWGRERKREEKRAQKH